MTNKKIAAPAAECPCTPVFNNSSQYLIGKEAAAHLELLLAYMASPLQATKEMVNAFYQRNSGYYCESRLNEEGREEYVWVVFDNSSGDSWVEDFKTEKEAIEWLGFSMLAKKRTADVLEAVRAAKERKERMWWKSGQAAAWAVMIAYTLFLVFSASQARADNAHDLKAFIDGGTQQTPTSKAPTAIKKAAYKPLDYLRLRDAVAGGAVEPSYTAIAFFSQTSPDETRRAIWALEREGVISWNSKKSKWELVK